MSDSTPDLAMYTSDELLDELCQRFDNAIFCGCVPHTEGRSMRQHRISGDLMSCAGLAAYVQALTINIATEDNQDFDG